jgi:hypothetical protein
MVEPEETVVRVVARHLVQASEDQVEEAVLLAPAAQVMLEDW